ncbi:hypothetical protein TNCV_3085551 [Trichonephila clavipes]|nr:hypothetical protein TNCV_3085551 [Trichonephila clavipes]
MWWNKLKDLPMWLRRKAVAKFRLTIGHDSLLKHLHRIHVAQALFYMLSDFREGMDADHIRRCPVLVVRPLLASWGLIGETAVIEDFLNKLKGDYGLFPPEDLHIHLAFSFRFGKYRDDAVS